MRTRRWDSWQGFGVGEDGPGDLAVLALVAVFLAATDDDGVRGDIRAGAGWAGVTVARGHAASPRSAGGVPQRCWAACRVTWRRAPMSGQE